MFERKYKEGEEIPIEDTAMNDLEGSIVSYENQIGSYRDRMRLAISQVKDYQDRIDYSGEKKRALERALVKLKR